MILFAETDWPEIISGLTQLITAIGAVVAAIYSVWAKVTAATKADVSAVQEEVAEIHTNTNSLSEKLNKATGRAGFLEGQKAATDKSDLAEAEREAAFLKGKEAGAAVIAAAVPVIAPQPANVQPATVQPVIDGIAEAVVNQLGEASDANKRDPLKERVPVTLPPPDRKDS